MQKVVDFLEKYCQWVAVGIAALFFLYALVQYLPGLSQPVVATDDSVAYGPAEIDPHITQVYVEPLEAKMASREKIRDAVPAYSQQFVERLGSAPEVAALPASAVASMPIDYKDLKIEAPKDDGIGQSGPGLVAQVPELPAATIDAPPDSIYMVATGFAQILTNPPPAGQPMPVAAPGVPPPPTKDVTWVRVPYTISMQRINLAFRSVNIPLGMDTSVLRVELVRQRQIAPDTWAPEEVVEPFTTGAPFNPLPQPGAPLGTFIAFKQWAEANQLQILQPAFYPVYGGEDPTFSKPVAVTPADLPFDPETFPMPPAPGSDISKLEPEQQKAVRAVRARRAKEAADARRGGGGRSTGGRPPRGGPEGGFEPRIGLPNVMPDVSRPIQLQYPRPGYPRPGAGGYPRPGGGMPDEYDPSMSGDPMDPGAGGPGQAMPGQQIVVPAPLPAPFRPDQVGSTDIHGFCYDVTARPDSTYRYRVRYYLANPVFNTKNVAVQKVADQFAIVGEDPNVWSQPIDIAPRTYIFLAQNPQPGSSSVRFTVYRWQDGRQYKALVTAGQGDSIGSQNNGIDFRTPWTLVEVRRDPVTNLVYTLLMNAEGKLRKRTYVEDSQDPLQKRLSDEVDRANAAAAAGVAAAGPGANIPQ